ncbi:MAG TPA: hypothetical protein V6C86_21005 [Oculatellaceae cyanobacterium]
MNLEDRILEILKDGKPIKADELVTQILRTEKVSESEIRGAFFPLVSTHQIEFGPNRTLKLGARAMVHA